MSTWSTTLIANYLLIEVLVGINIALRLKDIQSLAKITHLSLKKCIAKSIFKIAIISYLAYVFMNIFKIIDFICSPLTLSQCEI